MEKMKVSELMRPINEFPSISCTSAFLEATEELEKAQKKFDEGKVPENILIVHDEAGKIVGKISPMDIVLGLEPNYAQIDNLETFSHYGLVRSALHIVKKQYKLWQKPFAELCSKAYNIKIENIIKMPPSDHMVKIDDKMDAAFHLFVLLRHGSLFVKKGEEIVGLLRFSDVYKKIRQTMQECPLPS
jgi:predicted transcriptional regulator